MRFWVDSGVRRGVGVLDAVHRVAHHALRRGLADPDGQGATMGHADAATMTSSGAQPSQPFTRALPRVQSASGLPRGRCWPRLQSCPLMEDDNVAVNWCRRACKYGARARVIDLADDIMDTSVDPTSCNRESDTDVQASLTLEKVAANVAV